MSPHPIEGRRYTDTDHYEVSREKIREFARAVQDFHPAHWDDATARSFGHRGLVAPVTFASTVASLAQRSLMRAALDGYDPARLLHVEQDIRCCRPVTTGDRLTHEITVDSHRPIRGGDLIAVTTVIRDQADEVVQTVHTTLAGRPHDSAPTMETLAMLDILGPASEPRTPEPSAVPAKHPADRRIVAPNLTAGQFFPRRTFRLTRGELVYYAGISGDVNPIHWHDQSAQHANLDQVVAHGMLIMGLGAACLTEWLGVPDRIAAYYTQFATPVLIHTTRHSEIEFSGTVRAVDYTTRQATISLTAQCDGTATFGAASATVLLN
ncbi:fused (3R)-hydroxyacyl-ACP dehydratase subunits HadA/HadB [Nocardia sp. NPDC049149]|uniref:fused (3R)-hydroxyacyl-ACP dehydratase subunits HadA/HadB n=1 Tax=Nocardia sp. NPDC049149 TaxID=3364315 RepID=UPI00371B480C